MLKRQPNPFVFRIWEQIPFKFYCETIDDTFIQSKLQIPAPKNERFRIITHIQPSQYLFHDLKVKNLQNGEIYDVLYSKDGEKCYSPFYMYVSRIGDYISIHQDQDLLNRLIGSFHGKPLLKKSDMIIFDAYFNRVVSYGGQLVIVTEHNEVIKIE